MTHTVRGAGTVSEVRTTRFSVHPYFGFVCTPNSEIDFAGTVSEPLGHSAFAHIDAWGFRNRNVPDVKPPNEIWIGLFGGSVAFSIASSSDETTIAACLEQSLNSRARRTRRVRVLNFALPAGRQPQQLLIFALKAPLLDGVITFDGVNECVVPAHYNADKLPIDFPYRPIYEALFARSITDEQRALHGMIEEEERVLKGGGLTAWFTAPARRRRVESLRRRLRELVPESSTVDSIYPHSSNDCDRRIWAGADLWLQCGRTMHALASANRIDIVSILQPLPERGKPLTTAEHDYLSQHSELVSIRGRGYELLRRAVSKLIADGLSCIDFADVFADRSQSLYVDLIHFNDEGCRIVAEQIAKELNGWKCLEMS